MIPYLVFYLDVIDENFQQLVSQLKPWGVPLLVYDRRDNMRHLETRGQKGFYMGPGSGPSMDGAFLGAGGSRAVKQFRHVLVPPAYAQQHAMRMHLGHQHAPPELYDKAVTEAAGNAFAVDERVADEEVPYSDEPFMEELTGMDMFNSIRAAPPDPTGEAVAVLGDNLPRECGEHPALDRRDNDISQTLHTHRVWQRSADSPLHAPAVESGVLISRQCHESTPVVAADVFNYVTDKAYAEALGEPPLWGSGIANDKRYGEYGRVGTRSCQSVLPGTTRHRDRDVVEVAQSEEVKIVDAFPVQPLTRPLPPRSRFAKASRLLRCSLPLPQPTSDATSLLLTLLALHLRGEKTCAMAEGTARPNRQGRELDEGLGSGSGGDGQAQPDDRRDRYGQRLGPPPEVRVPAAPLRKNPLIRKRLVSPVNAVEHGCHGNACSDDVRQSPRLDENVHGDSAAFCPFW